MTIRLGDGEAEIVFEQSIKGLEMLDVENRIEMLEILLKDMEKGDG